MRNITMFATMTLCFVLMLTAFPAMAQDASEFDDAGGDAGSGAAAEVTTPSGDARAESRSSGLCPGDPHVVCESVEVCECAPGYKEIYWTSPPSCVDELTWMTLVGVDNNRAASEQNAAGIENNTTAIAGAYAQLEAHRQETAAGFEAAETDRNAIRGIVETTAVRTEEAYYMGLAAGEVAMDARDELERRKEHQRADLDLYLAFTLAFMGHGRLGLDHKIEEGDIFHYRSPFGPYASLDFRIGTHNSNGHGFAAVIGFGAMVGPGLEGPGLDMSVYTLVNGRFALEHDFNRSIRLGPTIGVMRDTTDFSTGSHLSNSASLLFGANFSLVESARGELVVEVVGGPAWSNYEAEEDSVTGGAIMFRIGGTILGGNMFKRPVEERAALEEAARERARLAAERAASADAS